MLNEVQHNLKNHRLIHFDGLRKLPPCTAFHLGELA
jgi:hypothetical protein